MKTMKKHLSLILCLVLCLSLALTAAGCQKAPGETTAPETPAESTGKEFSFTLLVIDGAGTETKFEITTTRTVLGDALLDEKLIEGEQGDYGMYIKAVNGITADYDKDGTYWGFYVDGEYAMAGVDTTEIAEGATYTLKVEKGS